MIHIADLSEDKMDKLFGFLFARPSFLEGVARILDFGNTLNEYINRSNTPEEADYYAIWADWRVVGSDIRRAASRVLVEHEQ